MKLKHLVLYRKLTFLIVTIITLSPQLLVAQTRNIRVVDNKKGASILFNSHYNLIKSACSDSMLYSTPSQAINQSRVIYCYDIGNQQQSTLAIIPKRKYKSFFDERILSFSICGTQYVFVCNNSIFVLHRTRGNKLQFVARLKNEYSFTNSFTLGKNILLYVCYSFHPEDVKNKHVWATLNLTENHLSQVALQTDDNALFGFFVNNWIDVCDSKIVYARSSEYTITIHNDQFQQIDSIKTTEFDGNKPYVKQLKERNLSSKDAISTLRQTDDSLLTRIRKVYFLTDTTLFVLIKLAGKQELRADYWLKSKGEWARIHQDFSPIWYEEGKSYSNEETIYTDFYQNTFDFPYYGNNQFYLVYFPFIPTISTTNFNKDEDYFFLQNEAIKNNELYFGIKEYHVTFPAL